MCINRSKEIGMPMHGMNVKRWVLGLVLVLLICKPASAQFLDTFEGDSLDGWTYFTGDGNATMEVRPGEGHASIVVDATQDRHNIWWALIKRDVSSALDLNRLSQPGYEIRVEARIRVSHAPRRVNLHVNTQRTTNFHTHLMEFDIPDTLGWHTISMTTQDFRAEPEDTVNAQMALIDWGFEKYRVEVDYFRVDVVDEDEVGPDEGAQVPYRPPIPDVDTFGQTVEVAQDGMVHLQYPDVNFDGWHAAQDAGKTPVLTVGGDQFVILRWDLQEYAGQRVDGGGLLELTTHSVQRTETEVEEFGQVRVVEILAGDPDWTQEAVTLHRLTQGQPLNEVFNPQMIIDVEVTEEQGGSTLITIPEPVLQRMLDGETLGLALRPLGPIQASFYAREYAGGPFSPRLHFDLERE